MAEQNSDLSRRDFLKRFGQGALAAGAAGTLAACGKPEEGSDASRGDGTGAKGATGSAGQKTGAASAGGGATAAKGDGSGFYRTLGRTGLKVSVVSIGAGSLGDPGLVARAVDLGINYIDTAICYGNSEEVLGSAFKQNKGLREKLIVATKWDARKDSSKQEILESLDNSLRRIGVDTIDIMQIHWLGGGHVPDDDGFNRLDNPALYEAMAEAKKAGKVRFFGATSHDGSRSKILQYAVKKGSFDTLLVKMSYMDYDGAGIPALLQAAKEANVGVVAMKSQPNNGQLPPGFEKSKWNAYQANLRWVLSKDVATVVHSGIGSDNNAQDEAVAAAREKLTEADELLLRRYAAGLSTEYCRGCAGHCQPVCPEGVSIAAALQFRMYDRHYGWKEYGRQLYAALPTGPAWSEACGECDLCTRACPFDLPVPKMLLDARERLA